MEKSKKTQDHRVPPPAPHANHGPETDADLSPMTAKQLERVTQDLRVHQMELEMQNDTLLKTQQELERMRDRYMDLYDFAPVGYFTLDPKGVIREANLSGAAMLGVARESLLSQPFTKFVHGDDQDHFYSCLQKLTATNTRGICELRLVLPEGGSVYVHLEAVAVREAETGGAGIRAVIHDITDRKTAEKAVKEAEEARLKALKFESFAVMTGGIAHDYNNLLSMILGNISLAGDEVGSKSDIHAFLQDAEEASLKAKDLTHELMILSKGNVPQKRSMSIRKTLRICMAEMPSLSKYSLKISLQEDLKPVHHDANQLKYAVGNILVNGMEAMPEGGLLTLKAENTAMGQAFKNSLAGLGSGEYVKISISDQGVGIQRENMGKIFDPYFSTKEMGVQKGMGLGLATAYAVVAKHGGRILVQSEVGNGTTVSIFLPTAENPEDPAPIAESGLPPEQASPPKADQSAAPEITSLPNHQSPIRRILVMDDEEILQKLIKQMLHRLGYEAETARDGLEALRLYQARKAAGRPFDAVILDLTIKGGMGGVEVVLKLREINPEVKAIVSSGYFNDPVMSDFRAYGFCGAIPKPFQKKELEELMEKVLG